MFFLKERLLVFTFICSFMNHESFIRSSLWLVLWEIGLFFENMTLPTDFLKCYGLKEKRHLPCPLRLLFGLRVRPCFCLLQWKSSLVALQWKAITQSEKKETGLVTNSILFYSVDFSQSRIGVKKCVFIKRTIKVCVSCGWQCPGTSAPSAAHQTVSFYLCSSGSNA